MRSPQDLSRPARRVSHRGRIGIVVAVVLLIVVLASLRTVATFYTDYLWFGSVHLGEVWRRLLVVKLSLFLGAAAVFFLLLWVNLSVVDRLAPSELALGPEDELVRRYQHRVAPHAVWVRTIVSVIAALIAASGAVGQWQNFLLFVDGVYFHGPHSTDPQFHKNIGFFLFELPFLSFLVSWVFVSLLVVLVITVIAHYLNGGIRLQSGTPSVAPQVKVHVSVLLAAMAIVKAFGYILARYHLDLSQNGFVQGAGYTDVHARLPALTLLILISLLAAVIFLVNIRRRGWALPVLGLGLWAFVAVVVGAIYPAIFQALRVNPAQNALERPYIQRNIQATRAALGINDVQSHNFAADNTVGAATLALSTPTLNNVRLWDPEWTINTFTKQQAIRTYYSFNTLAIDRYRVGGQLTPVVVGVRQVNDNDLPSQGWVNTHLQYTHGYGMIVSLANQSNNGLPVFGIKDVPPTSSNGLPTVSQPSVYFGIANPNGGDADYVVGDTRQPEIDYQRPNGSNVESSYHGSGGVVLNNWITRAAFAVRFGDLNLLISDLLTPHSRLMFVRDVTQMAEKAAPFLSYDSDPYPVLVNGQIDWVLDAYTTSDNYPYAQNADVSAVAPNSGLQQAFNYARNSVKVVVNAYTGKMTFYDVTSLTHQPDPVLETWKRAFPGMFTPVSKMPAALRAHLRYPEDLFAVQASMYGRYHLTNANAFYSAANAWDLSQSPGAGPPQAALPTTFTTNAQGQIVSTGQVQRMAPLYQVMQLPGQKTASFDIIDAYVPVSPGNQIQTLAGFITAGSDPDDYGRLQVYVTPPGTSTDGPALIDARISQNPAVSRQISLLNTNGSEVILGNVLMVPVGQSMVYFRPLYVQSSRNPAPQLQYVIAVYSGPGGQSQVAMEPTLTAVLTQVFKGVLPAGGTIPGLPSSSTATPAANAEVRDLIAQANADFTQSQTDLKAGNFAAYGNDLAQLQSALQQLHQMTTPSTTTNPPTTTNRSSTKPHAGASASSSTTTTTIPSGET